MKTLQDLYVGATVYDPACPIKWRVWEQRKEGTLLFADNIIRQMCFDAREPGNPDGLRASYGNNDYTVSNIDGWLNGLGAEWYKPQHEHDAAPDKPNIYDGDNPYSKLPGFLTNFSPAFRAALVPTDVESRDHRGDLRVITRLVWLPSATELGFDVPNGYEEGHKLPLADNPRMRIAAPTAECVESADWQPDHFATTKPWYYWLRSPYSGYSCDARYVNTSGDLSNLHAYNGGNGVRPLCILKSCIKVSDTERNGCASALVYE